MSVLTLFELFVISSALGFWWSILHRMTHPYECTCGATYVVYDNYKKHVQQKHGVA
ncbi:hypothetical protein KDH_51670 [Dictyobacter sp. S3.2.2.5]|uniref:C2H2-type domain-containing protein n=1 Tax=Dictyobacter halimunensis TaxID=3026934 RepID=A0ABQ6G0M7_9CHLR|nr:hypothetical protein KDH_51670 [Dictyobacter sp. S3.2.2.5]